MNFSPLRKQVESLNKQLESQNIQIKDLINFLSRSTQKQNVNPKQIYDKSLITVHNKDQKSNKSALSSIFLNSKRKQKSIYSQYTKNGENQKQTSLKKINNQLQFTKSKQNRSAQKQFFWKNIQMTKNINTIKQDALINLRERKKYLHLSQPGKKLNSSCSFCRQSCSKIIPQTQRENISSLSFGKQPKSCSNIMKSDRLTSLYSNKSMSRPKKSTPSKNSNRKKNQSNSASFKKVINSSHISKDQSLLLKSQIKSFIQKKSFKNGSAAHNKIKLFCN